MRVVESVFTGSDLVLKMENKLVVGKTDSKAVAFVI